jgi:hypothetical protein
MLKPEGQKELIVFAQARCVIQGGALETRPETWGICGR